jgi:hypothetical protein
MKHFLRFPIGIFIVFAATFPGWGGRIESNRERHAADSKERVSMNESVTIPIVPETTAALFENSDVIAYGYIDNVEGGIEKSAPGRIHLDRSVIYPEQRCTATLLWILKGDAGLKNRTVSVVKKRSRYFVSEKEKRVLYLKKEGDFFHTVDRFGGEHRLASALCDIRNLKRDAESGGIVASFQGIGPSSRPVIHVLKGRQKTSLRINDAAWRRFLLKSSPIGEFDICEIPLEKGTCTVLMEMGGQLSSYTRLINDYYACVNVGEYRWWEPLYFAP